MDGQQPKAALYSAELVAPPSLQVLYRRLHPHRPRQFWEHVMARHSASVLASGLTAGKGSQPSPKCSSDCFVNAPSIQRMCRVDQPQWPEHCAPHVIVRHTGGVTTDGVGDGVGLGVGVGVGDGLGLGVGVGVGDGVGDGVGLGLGLGLGSLVVGASVGRGVGAHPTLQQVDWHSRR